MPKSYSEKWKEVTEKNKELGEGLVVGKVVTFGVADGRAAYEIVEIGDDISKVKYRPDLCPDRYTSQAVNQDGRIFTDTLESACKRTDFTFN